MAGCHPSRRGAAPRPSFSGGSGPSPLRSQPRPAGGEGVFVQCWGRWGEQEAEFQSGFTLCYPFPAPPPHPRLHSRTRGGSAPGEIRLTGGSGYSLGARGGAGLSRPHIPDGGARPPDPHPGTPSRPPAPGGRGRSSEEEGVGAGQTPSLRAPVKVGERALGRVRVREPRLLFSAQEVTSDKTCRAPPDLMRWAGLRWGPVFPIRAAGAFLLSSATLYGIKCTSLTVQLHEVWHSCDRHTEQDSEHATLQKVPWCPLPVRPPPQVGPLV